MEEATAPSVELMQNYKIPGVKANCGLRVIVAITNQSVKLTLVLINLCIINILPIV